MTMRLSFDVVGAVAAHGNKRAFRNQYSGRIQMVETSKKAVPWRQDVIAAAETAIEECNWEHGGMPVRVIIDFYFPRPKGHFRTGKNSHFLRDSAPQFPAGKPDCDKALRSTFDAMTLAGCFQDDARIVEVVASKRYADHNRPGAHIEVWLLTQDRHAYTRPRGGDDAYYDLPGGAVVTTFPVQESFL